LPGEKAFEAIHGAEVERQKERLPDEPEALNSFDYVKVEKT
jgi:hypothetical protein